MLVYLLFELVLDFEEAEMIRFALSCIASLAVSFLPTPLVSAFECLFAFCLFLLLDGT